jgi:hypothetical protein
MISFCEREVLNRVLPHPLPIPEDLREDGRTLVRGVFGSARERLYLSAGSGVESGLVREVDSHFAYPPDRISRGTGAILPEIEVAETADELIARTVLDVSTAVTGDSALTAAASYNILFDAGLVGPETFAWEGREFLDESWLSNIASSDGEE